MILNENPQSYCPLLHSFVPKCIYLVPRQVQKSNWINSDCQSRLDQFGLTRINSEDHKKIINLRKLKPFTHLKVKIPLKSRTNYWERLAWLCLCVVKLPFFCNLSQFDQDWWSEWSGPTFVPAFSSLWFGQWEVFFYIY